MPSTWQTAYLIANLAFPEEQHQQINANMVGQGAGDISLEEDEMQFFRRFNRQHEVLVKLGGALGFLVVVASLYFFVLSGMNPGNASAGAPLQTTPLQFGSGSSPVSTAAIPTFPTEPPASPTPPLLPPRYQVSRQYNLNYGEVGTVDERLDLCMPVGAAGPRPGVVLIHDQGAANISDKSVYASLCSLLASQGFVAVAVNFRSYPNVWPDNLEDVQLAVRWLRANADKYHLDPARVCAWGDSLGGFLSVFLGVLGTIYPGDEAYFLTGQSPRVSCVVDDFGFVDLTTLPDDAFWQSALGFEFGQDTPGVPLVTPEKLHEASPIFYVDSQSAPMLIVHGTLDTVVPITQSEELQQALQRAQVPVSYMTYPGGHSFSELSQQQINAITLKIISYLTTQEQP